MKKRFLSALVLAFVFGIILPSTSFASTDLKTEKESYEKELSGLTQEEVIANFERIDQEYDIGEEFSLKDQTFVEMYATPIPQNDDLIITPLASKYVSGTRTVNGITVTVSGTIKDDIQNVINQSFGASNLRTRTTAGSSKVSSIKTTVHHNAYGLVGSGGIGKVYSGTLSTTGKNSTLNGTKRYTAVVAYASTWATATVKHSGGTFTVNPN